MTLDGLFEHALAVHDPAPEFGVTDRAAEVQEWCAKYGARWGWTAGTTDLLGACGPGSAWHGAPTAVPGSLIDTSTMLMRPLADRAILVLTVATVRPEPARTLLVAGLLDEHAAGLAAFSAVCRPALSRSERAWAAATGGRTTGLPLGRTGERLAMGGVEDFTVLSAAPLAAPVRRALRAALAGWRGHVRVQSPPGASSALFMAWQWHGADPVAWSARADHTLGVLRTVRDALITTPRQ